MEIRLEQIAKSFDKRQVIHPTTLAAGNFTLDHYKELLTTPKALSSIWKSLFLAVSSATICSVIGTAVVAAVRRSGGLFRKVLEGISLLPEMLPGIVLIIGIMLFWNAIYKVLLVFHRFVGRQK